MRNRLLAAEKVKAIDWREGGLYLLDQRDLPGEQGWLPCPGVADVARAIAAKVVSAPSAVAIVAAYGLVLAARARFAAGGDWVAALEADFALLAAAPANPLDLSWTLGRMRERLQRVKDSADPLAALEAEALAIHESDRDANLTMAQLGVELIRRHQGNAQAILTHGNSGALASGGFGTALGVIRSAFLEGMVERVFANEARPLLQGARLTAWELAADGIPVTVSADSAAAHIMKTKGVTWVIVAAERIAANGDVVGAMGTYQLSVCAMHHGVRFMVVAPSARIDLALASGDELAIAEEAGDALLAAAGRQAEAGVETFSPVFDVTPADLIDVIVTEKGVVERPDSAKLAQLMCRKRLH